jgi:hypothetical protein
MISNIKTGLSIMKRREFLSAASAFAAAMPAARSMAADASFGEAKLTVGILSDPHLVLPMQKEKGALFK